MGELVALSGVDPTPDPSQLTPPVGPPRRSKSARGFDIHAAVAVTAADREGRERLLRYCARAPLGLERLSILADGCVAYRTRSAALSRDLVGEKSRRLDAMSTQAAHLRRGDAL